MSTPEHKGEFVIRGLSERVMARLKVAAALHQQSRLDYVRTLIMNHLDDLERRGVTLELPPKAGRAKP